MNCFIITFLLEDGNLKISGFNSRPVNMKILSTSISSDTAHMFVINSFPKSLPPIVTRRIFSLLSRPYFLLRFSLVSISCGFLCSRGPINSVLSSSSLGIVMDSGISGINILFVDLDISIMNFLILFSKYFIEVIFVFCENPNVRSFVII